MLKNIKTFIKKRRLIIGAVIAVVVIIFIGIKLSSNGAIETVSPVIGNFVKEVKISGKVIPSESVDLGFEISGIVASISKSVGEQVYRGESIARLNTSSLSADILKAEAELAVTQAVLAGLQGTSDVEAEVTTSKLALIQTIKDALSRSEDAVYNKTDQFIIHPNTDYPVVGPTIDDSSLSDEISDERVLIGQTLTKWKTSLSTLTVATYSDNILKQSKNYLMEISAYISDVSRVASLFEADNVYSQTTIDLYRTDVTTARNNLNTASQTIIADENALKGLLQDIPAQLARVEAARATLTNYRSQISKASIISPIDGVISRQDAKVGETITASQSLVSVISAGLIIETYIPEVLIAEVKIGNVAKVTLDAYGRDVFFKAEIVQIDPAETIRDGVSTYRVKLALQDRDERIRSGMTANVVITTMMRPDILLIPERAVFVEDGVSYVYVLSGSDNVKTRVDVGARDSSGNIELLTELSLDTKIITSPSAD